MPSPSRSTPFGRERHRRRACSIIRSPRRRHREKCRRSRRASCGCGCRCRSRSITSICGCSRSGTADARSSTAAIGDAPTRALWERHFAATLDTMPIRRIVATHYHPDHVGNAAWLSGRFDAPVAMTHAEYLTAHAVAGGFGGHTPEATIDLFRRHGMAEADRDALARRGNLLPARRAGTAAGDRYDAGRRRLARRGHVLADHRWPRAFAGSRGALQRGARRADLRRHAAAEDLHQRQRPRVRPRRRSAAPVPRFDIGVPGPARGHAGAAVARPAVSRHCATRRATPGAPRRKARSSSRMRCGPRRSRSARPISFPCCSGACSTSSSATSPWARRSPISTTSGARRGSGALSTRPARYDSLRP